MVRNEDILKDILLKMNYDPSKTLNENSSILEQPESVTDRRLGIKSKNDKTYATAPSSGPDYWTVGCRYPEKALEPPEIEGMSIEGKDLMIAGFCYYPVAAQSPKGGTAGMWVPAQAEILWQSQETYFDILLNKIQERNEGSTFYGELSDEEILTIIANLLPEGTIAQIYLDNQRMVAPLVARASGILPSLTSYSIKGYFYMDDGSPYLQPKLEDNRNEWQKFWDEWGTVVQIGTALLAVVASIATGGLAGMALLATEIAVEGTIGAILAHRELEKGNNAGAIMELAFGLTPWLKTTKWAKTISKADVADMSNKMKKANLGLKSNPDDVRRFYDGLSDVPAAGAKLSEKEIFSILVKDTSNELSEAALKKALGRELAEEVYDYVRKNPGVFKSMSWYQKVWAKETKVNAFIMLTQIVYGALFEEELSPEDERKAIGIATIIPDELQEHFQMQLFQDPNNVKDYYR